MDKRTAICEYLRQNHLGIEKAVHSRELQELFSVNDRTLRRKISSLRQDGYPICSGDTGYYYAENQKEINATVARLNSLVLGVSDTRAGLQLASSLNPKTYKIILEIQEVV